MPGCDCQHCAKDNDGVRRTANRISMAQLVAFHLDQSATKGANPLPDMCNVCVLKYQIKLSQRSYLKEFPSSLFYHVLDDAKRNGEGKLIKVPVRVPLSALAAIFEE
jgi:hypothetical protein